MKKHLYFIQYSAPCSLVVDVVNSGIVYSVVGRQGGSFHLKTFEAFNEVLSELRVLGVTIIRTRESNSVPKFI